MTFITSTTPITVELIKEANAHREWIPTRRCIFCGEEIGYQRVGNRLFFNGNCGCVSTDLPLRSAEWEDLLRWVRAQTNPSAKNAVLLLLDIAVTED